MTVPPELVGAWRRVGLTLDGRRLVDYCDVIWLQTPSWFADVRLRLAPDPAIPADGVAAWLYAAAAFAGLATWSAPMMTWRHELDLYGSVPPGTNRLRWDDGVLVEYGETEVDGRPVAFSEEWLRMTGENVACSVRRDGPGLRVEVGRWAIELAGGSAARFEAHGGEWTQTGRLTA